MNHSNLAPKRRAAVVINPMKSPGGDFKSAVHLMCTEEGWGEPLWLETSEEDPGSGQARKAMESGADVVMAAGGDGTVRCVAGALAGTGTPMGIVPLGTGNLLARNLGIVLADPLRACRDILNGANTKIDVALATLDHAKERHLFLVAAGLGYDAAIMADTKDQLKDRVGWLAYVEAGIRNLPGQGVKASIKGGRQGCFPAPGPWSHGGQLRKVDGWGGDFPGRICHRWHPGPFASFTLWPVWVDSGGCRHVPPQGRHVPLCSLLFRQGCRNHA